ncbi:MAG: phenylalanine--tRNA ligase subunit beta [Chloroflexi bacterium]|nr:phenylalanine--tRNA ligase subunit beta [Chloroflexota bacterium]
MKVPLSWLKDYVDITLSPEELAERLTLAGLEVGGIEYLGKEWEGIRVGRINTLERHPNADRLLVARIDTGRGEVTVVTGAPNLSAGDKVPLGLPGAKIIDAYSPNKPVVTVKKAKLRGLESEGVVASEKELGLGEDHSGVLVLYEDAPIGAALVDVLGDVVLDLELTPNLAHALSMVGVAREVAALTGARLHLPEVQWQATGAPIEGAVSVEVVDAYLCPRYSASLIRGVTIGPSPLRLRQRLIASGMRPINNIVDITNYVMLEWGQPLHAFDYDKLAGRRIIVRTARPGEQLTAIDHVARELSPEMLVIADADRASAVAGVMGGLDSEVGPDTTSILLESANFNPISIRRTARALKMRTEAALRFEKALDPELTMPALQHASELMRVYGGGEIARGVADVYLLRPEIRRIDLSPQEVHRILGMRVSTAEIVEILGSFGFGTEVVGGDRELVLPRAVGTFGEGGREEWPTIIVTVPTFRRDVTLPADLIEEVARAKGYDRIPTSLLSATLPKQELNEVVTAENRIRDILVGAGMQEVITYSLTDLGTLRKLFPRSDTEVTVAGMLEALTVETDRIAASGDLMKVANPLSPDHEYLRPTLMASLLELLSSNLKHSGRVALFEVARAFIPRASDRLPVERRTVTGVISGQRQENSWLGHEGLMDFFDVKGAIETLFSHLGISDCRFEPGYSPTLHPGRTANVVVNGESVGLVGEVHPLVRENFELPDQPVGLFDLNLELLLAHMGAGRYYRSLSRFPAVVQDLAVVVDESVSARAVRDTIREGGGDMVGEIELFDVYAGKSIPEGKKSLAYTITYQAMNRTLTDEEVAKIRGRIQRRLEQNLGAKLRA